MLLPVFGFYRNVGDRVTAMQHHTVSNVKSDVTDTSGVVCAGEEYEVAGADFAFADRGAY